MNHEISLVRSGREEEETVMKPNGKICINSTICWITLELKH